MIVLPGTPRPGGTLARLLGRLVELGHEIAIAPDAKRVEPAGATLLVTDELAHAEDWIAAAATRVARILVVSRIGAHRDAKAPALLALWRLEESARATGRPTLTLRLGPVIGPESPLARKLASRPPLPRDGRWLLNPVWEEDAVETFDRALRGVVAWESWYEVAGEEVWSLAELAAAAESFGAHPGGAWDPPPEEMAEHRLAEAAPWLEHFALPAVPLSARLEAQAMRGARS